MNLLEIVFLLIVVGVLLWLVNGLLGQYIAQPILGIINAVVITAVVLWLLAILARAFGLVDSLNFRIR